MAISSRQRGNQIEHLAENYLIEQGLTLWVRNFSCRYGEIDRVFWHGSTLVFTEIRYRRSSHWGSGAETVTATKQRRLRQTAEIFLERHFSGTLPDCRFDVISGSGDPVQLQWLPDAF